MHKSRIVPVKQAEIKTIESTVSIVDVQKAQLKVIENSDAWEEHQKTHAGAQLQIVGVGDKKGLGDMEKALFDADKKKPKEDAVFEDGKKKREEEPLPGVAYKAGGNPATKGAYHGHGEGGGAILGQCTCGQTFKADDKGVSPYKLTTEVTKEGQYSEKHEGHGYKKKEEEFGGSYKNKSVHDEVSRKYSH